MCKGIAEDPKWKADFVSMPRVLRVNNLGDSGIDIKILGDTKPMRQWDIIGELRLRLKKAFDREGIEIPFARRVLIFKGIPPAIPTSK